MQPSDRPRLITRGRWLGRSLPALLDRIELWVKFEFMFLCEAGKVSRFEEYF